MRKFFLAVLFLVVITAYLNAQAQNNSERTRVNQTVTKLFDGIAALDTKMIKQYSAKDFLLLEDGAVWNMDTLTSKLNQLKGVPFSRTNHLDFIQTEVKGNAAWVAYNNAADITVNGQKRSVLKPKAQ